MSAPALAAEPSAAPGPVAPTTAGGHPDRPRASRDWVRSPAWVTLLSAAILSVIAFAAGGGLTLSRMTTVEIALTLGTGVVVVGAILLTPAGRRVFGLWPMALLLAFAALSALSVVWSVQPDDSWQDAGRMLAYSGVFGASVMLARAFPERWAAMLGGVALAAFVVCGYALLTKVFPEGGDTYARLQQPYGYWNATGLTAAMGVIACLWLGGRRAGHALVSALSYPATGVLLVTLMLAYSRGALVALAVGLVLWFWVVPLRLRGAAVLLTGALGAAVAVGWTFSQHALNTDNLPLAERVDAGHQLGVLLAALVVVLSIAGATIGFRTARRPPSAASRHTTGALLLTLIALAIVGFAGVLATSQRGLFGSISHGVSSLADPHAKVPPNTPSRLTAIGSVRARYWNEALKIFQAHPALGAGAAGYETARLRYRTETLDVKHAHGYVVQTLSDLGLVGLALTLALLAAWLAAAGAATRPFQRRISGWRWVRAPTPYTPERIGLLSMLCLVVVFGAHSFMDWTWYVPGDACVALLCAGWLAGRGPLAARAAAGSSDRPATSAAPAQPLASPAEDRPRRRLALRDIGTERIVIAAAVLIVTLLAAWAQWQPERSADASDQALSALAARDQNGALRAAQSAVDEDPLSAQALLTLSAVQQATGRVTLARTTLQRAVKLQPSNPQTWLALGEFDLPSNPKGALGELRAAIYLDPESISAEAIANNDPTATALQNDYVRALRASTQVSAVPTPAATPSSGSRPTGKRPSSRQPAGTRSTSKHPKPATRSKSSKTSRSASAERARALSALRALPTR
jgi:O-Antigen ligase